WKIPEPLHCGQGTEKSPSQLPHQRLKNYRKIRSRGPNRKSWGVAQLRD
ncbi:hypothetical protein AVDCRST_MAG84-6745, partial [uncultured Microcoleus sp.]